MAPGISKEDENLGVVYEEVDGGYVVDGDMFFEYYIVLTGKDPNAAHGTQFIVLTNDQHITYEQVSKSFLSSNSADSLSGTIVIGMKTIDWHKESVSGVSAWFLVRESCFIWQTWYNKSGQHFGNRKSVSQNKICK